MTSRACCAGIATLLLNLCVGCDTFQSAGPIRYRESERAATELASKPKLREKVRVSLENLFGADLQHIKAPANSGLREGGIYLANSMKVGDRIEPVTEQDPASGHSRAVEGGYALYRNHCLHCHGVFGAGDGPTAAFLFPRPRDYRPGVFKFTSTNPTNAKPSRADLRKTLLYGLHGTSMPGFEATMSLSQIEQVMDYLTFLSIRGETERYLIDLAAESEDNDTDALEADMVGEVLQKVTTSWTEAETQVVNPAVRRVAASPESIRRGRDLYLGANTSGPKLECVGCHGINGQGNGSAFIERTIFDDVVFRQYSFDEAAARTFETQKDQGVISHASQPPQHDPTGVVRFLTENPAILTILRNDHKLFGDEVSDPQFAYLVKNDMSKVAAAARRLLPDLDDPEFRGFLVSKYDLWKSGSLDVWNNPLRPANLIDGVYKGGRRPIDLYWRIAKGINGAKMPAHANILTDEQIWDIINFILALPNEPNLLKESAPAAQPARTAVALPTPGHEVR